MRSGSSPATRMHSFLTNVQVTGAHGPRAPGAPEHASPHPYPGKGLRASWCPAATQEQAPGEAIHPGPQSSAAAVFCRVALFLEPSWGKFTEGKQVIREGGVNNWQPLFPTLRT